MDKRQDELRIRLLTPADKKRVYNFFRSIGAEAENFFNREKGNEIFLNEFLDGAHRDRIYWAAVENTEEGEIAGIVFLWSKDTKVPWLGICVNEKWKGKHLGRRLMSTANDWAKKEGAGGILLTVFMDNIRAQSLYERMGYERIGTCGEEYVYILAFPNEQKNINKFSDL